LRTPSTCSGEFFIEQVGQLVVARQAEVDQHGCAVGTQEDIAGLDVEVDHVLAVQLLQRVGDLDADLDHVRPGQGRRLQAR
jgi:hypothetical protein